MNNNNNGAFLSPHVLPASTLFFLGCKEEGGG